MKRESLTRSEASAKRWPNLGGLGRVVTTAALSVLLVLGGLTGATADPRDYSFAGSLQLDYLGVPTERHPRTSTLDATTVELSLRAGMDFTARASATVKVCFACHGFELGMAYVNLRAADELVVRVGRMTPAFGSFPLRHDPANHRASDKPLVYDMGRMLRLRDWNEGILPAPWVDNGIEVHGTHFFAHGRVEYAAYLVSGPKAGTDPVDFDFTLSRSPAQYYVDNNSQPVIGGRVGGALELNEQVTFTAGASAMTGSYNPERAQRFTIAGVDLVAQLGLLVLRGEYLFRRTEMALTAQPSTRFKYGPGPDGRYADYFVKDGFYAEAELPVGRVDTFLRFDGLRRRGNVLATSELSSRATLYRYTAGAAVRVDKEVRIKASVELYQFGDFADELALHLGVATPF